MSPTPIRLSPDSNPRLDGRSLLSLIDLYIADRAQRRQYKTAIGYQRKLAHFADWWQATGPGCGYILTDTLLVDFARHLERKTSARGKPLSWHSRNDVHRRLRSMFSWAQRRGYIAEDWSGYVPAARGSEPARVAVGLDVVSAMLDAASSTSYPARNRAIVAVLAGTGIRCEECAALRVEEVTVYADRCGLMRLTVAKNDRERVVAFDSFVGDYLVKHLDGLSRSSGPLWPSRVGAAALTPSGVYKVLRSLAHHAGVEKRIQGAHDLRRLFATRWIETLKGEGYARLLQKQMGHASFAMTTKYILQDVGEVLDVLREGNVSPLAGIAVRGNAH